MATKRMRAQHGRWSHMRGFLSPKDNPYENPAGSFTPVPSSSPREGYDLGGDLKYLQTTWSLPEPLKMARVLDLHSVHQEVAPPAAPLT